MASVFCYFLTFQFVWKRRRHSWSKTRFLQHLVCGRHLLQRAFQRRDACGNGNDRQV